MIQNINMNIIINVIKIVQYEYNNKCYKNCSNGFLNDKECKCELDQCLVCPPPALYKNLCSICNTNYYPRENDPSNFLEYFQCYKDLKGYYLDKNESLYKKCYYSCDTCEIKGNNIIHNCLSCYSY